MRLAISNIAWDTDEDEATALLLRRFDIDAVDVAPGKYFPEPAQATDAEIGCVRSWWRERGLEVTGMQALLFGTTGLNVFGSPEAQDAMLRHLAAVCRIGAGLGASRLVFGSPRNRDRTGLSDDEAMDVALGFFRRLGDSAQSHGVVICLEPNPVRYGANFMTSSADTAEVVRRVAHPAIAMQFDTGSVTINGEDPGSLLQEYSEIVGHVHASEPDLVPLGDGSTDHVRMASALKEHLASRLVCIEMLATRDEPHLVSIERALQQAIRHYRDDGDGIDA